MSKTEENTEKKILNKKLKDVEISIPIVYGNIAFWLGKKANEYQSHKWTVYVRGATNEDLGVVIKRAVFQLHSSFNNPTRVIEAPPFELSESGWGEFEIAITLYFHNDVCDKPLNLYHHLKLYPEDESGFVSIKKPVVAKNELDGDDNDAEEDPGEGDHKLPHETAPEYKRLIAIPAGKPKGGLEECLKVDPDNVRRLSLSEQQLEDAAETHGKEIVRFTQRNILRVYPKGIRVNSSNYNPLIGWMHGAQMVAFNMQGYGRSLWMMQGMFRANGGCGFVKKPDFLLKSGPHGEVFDPKAKLPVQKTLKVKVYMGEGWYYDFHHTHFDAYSPPDFYVRVGIAGVPADTGMKKTKTLEDNWIPVWDEEFEFPLTVPELALLRIEVHEYDMSEKDDFGGQTCLPVWELREGIRAVPLHDRKGRKYNSVKLLVRVEFV